jgi:hypothetical protein
MPGSRRTFTYVLTPKAEDTAKVAQQARRVLGWACEGDSRVECHDVTGDALGIVTLNLTVLGRDQWACRQVAQDILNHVTWGLQQPADLQLESRRFPPHTKRGYGNGRTKTWRDPRSPEEAP